MADPDNPYTVKRLRTAFQRGKNAFTNGCSKTECPYDPIQKPGPAAAWFDGRAIAARENDTDHHAEGEL